MQTTPIDLLDKNFLESVDMLVRQGTREICGLPADIPIAVYYTGRKYRELGMLRVSWEASIQHIAIAQKLAFVQDPHLLAVRDLCQEEAQSRARLGSVTGLNPRTICTELRCNEFN
jgi:hypothetical protein